MVLAGCLVDRGAIAAALAPSSENGGGCDSSPIAGEPMNSAVCIAHCTSDLQAAGMPVAMVADIPDAPVLVVPRAELHFALTPRPESQPPDPVPPRIRFQSFLI